MSTLPRAPEFRVARFGPTRLYLEDVERLHDLFTTNLQRVSMEANGLIIPSPADLPQAGRVVRSFQLRGFDPFVDVALGTGIVSAYCADVNKPAALGVFTEVTQLLANRRANFGQVRGWPLVIVQWLTLGVIFFTGISRIGATVLLVLNLFVGALALWIGYRSTRHRGIVFTTRSSDKIGWVERNADALVIATIAAIVGTITGGLVVAIATGAIKP